MELALICVGSWLVRRARIQSGEDDAFVLTLWSRYTCAVADAADVHFYKYHIPRTTITNDP